MTLASNNISVYLAYTFSAGSTCKIEFTGGGVRYSGIFSRVFSCIYVCMSVYLSICQTITLESLDVLNHV